MCLRALIHNGMGISCCIFIPLCIEFWSMLLEFHLKINVEYCLCWGLCARFIWCGCNVLKDFSAAILCCWINSIFNLFNFFLKKQCNALFVDLLWFYINITLLGKQGVTEVVVVVYFIGIRGVNLYWFVNHDGDKVGKGWITKSKWVT